MYVYLTQADFVIRNVLGVISLAWNARTSRVVGFIERIPDSIMRELRFLLKSCSRMLGHPLMLPEIFVQLNTTKLNNDGRVPWEGRFLTLEERTSVSNNETPDLSNAYNAVWSWKPEDFEDVTTQANKTFVAMVVYQRGLGVTKQLVQHLLSLLDEINSDRNLNARFKDSRHQWKQRLSNRVFRIETYENQTENVQKRITNLNSVVSRER